MTDGMFLRGRLQLGNNKEGWKFVYCGERGFHSKDGKV